MDRDGPITPIVIALGLGIMIALTMAIIGFIRPDKPQTLFHTIPPITVCAQ